MIFRRLFIFFSLLGCCLQTDAQMYRYETGFTVSKQHFCDTLALNYVNHQLLLDVELGGKRCRALLDTGAAQGVTFVNRLPGDTKELGHVVVIDGNGRRDTIRVVQLPELKIGSLAINGYVAVVHQPLPVKEKYDLIIGFDLFNKGLSGKIDTANGRLILSDRSDVFAREEGFRQKYKLKWHVPYTIISPFKRHADETCFDTGFAGLYMMNKTSFDRHLYKSKQVAAQVEALVQGQSMISLLGVEQTAEVAFMNLDRLRFGKFELRGVKARTGSGSSKLGAELLRYGSMVILPQKKTLLFQPYGGGLAVEANNQIKQIAFIPVDNKPTVGLVNPESEQYKKGVRSGDVVVAINHQPVNTFRAFVNYPFVEGEKYLFTFFTADGKRKDILLPR